MRNENTMGHLKNVLVYTSDIRPDFFTQMGIPVI